MKYEVTDAIMTQAIHAAIKETGLLKLISTLDFELKAAKEENERLRKIIADTRLIAVDAQLRATYQRTALEIISDILCQALNKEPTR